MQKICDECLGKTCVFHAKDFCTQDVPCTQVTRGIIQSEEGQILSEVAFSLAEELSESIGLGTTTSSLTSKMNGVMCALSSLVQGDMTAMDENLRKSTLRVRSEKLGCSASALRLVVGLPDYGGQKLNKEGTEWL